MATTAGGTPYVEATDTVTSYPTTSLALANRVDTVAASVAAGIGVGDFTSFFLMGA